MKNLLALAVIAAAGAARASTSSELGYVTDGLTAHWDAIDNQATGTHSASAATWVDLVGGATFTMTDTTWGDEYCRFPTAASCGTLADSSLLAWDSTVSTARTVEVVLKYDTATANGICFVGTTASRIAIGRYDSGKKWIVSSSGHAAKIDCRLDNTEFGSVSFGFVKGVAAEGYLYNSLTNAIIAVATVDGYNYWSGNSTIYVGSCSSGYSGMVGNVYAVRIYDRLLTAEEVAQNYRADEERFLKTAVAKVESGSIVVGGVTYAAGESVVDWRTNTTVTIESASAASVRLADTVTGLSLATGSLGLAGDSMQTLSSLALGAGAALTLPSDVLTVTGAITADAAASVVGPGLLVGTAATSPVALTGGAQYISSTAAWTGWPSSGFAYIPDGSPVEILAEDVANVAALDGIVFGGASAKVTCSIAGGYTLSTPLSGPGTFAFVSAGDSVITADNRDFTGSFLITNTTCTVSNEFGLGGVDAQTCDFYVGNVAKSLWFGNVSPVFTNHVAVCEHVTLQSTSAATVTFGTRSTAEVLVQDADFTIANSASSGVKPTYTISGNVKFMKRYGMAISTWGNSPSLSLSAGGGVWFLGTFSVTGTGLLYSGSNGTYHFGLDSGTSSAPWLMYTGATLSSAGGNNSCKMDFYGYQWFNVDLNGNDLDFGKYGGGISGNTPAVTSTRSFSLTSAEPAQLRFCGLNTMAVNPDVSGAAGITMAGTGSYTLLGKSGQPSTSTGAIMVENGTLTLGETFEWVGTNVTVSGGALVVGANAPKALSKGVAHLVVTGGTFAVQSGGGVALKSARFGEKTLADGPYTMAALRADPDVAPFIGSAADDAAEITVDSEEAGEWTGWHAGDVVVPKNAAVTVTAEDLPIISNVTSLTLGNASTVSFSGLGPIDLDFPIAGGGTVSFADSDEVVIFSDNSGLVSPGHFEFARTHVCVSNRFGLGSSATGACMFYTTTGTSNGKRLRFRGPASTNDVAVVFDHCMTFGSDDPLIGTFVQNADIEQTDGGYNNTASLNKAFTPVGSVEFTAAIKLSDVTSPEGSVMRFASTSSLMGVANTVYMYGTENRKVLYLDAPMPVDTQIDSIRLFQGFDVYIGADYAISLCGHDSWKSSGSLISAYGKVNFHMGGHPARVGSLSIDNGSWTSEAATTTFDSDLPATLFITNILAYGTSYDYYNAVRFTGAASLDYYSVVATQYLGNARSDTTGSLTVRHGDLVMDYGSYWGGTNVTITGGTLHIGANAATNSVTGACTFFTREATLSLSGSGTLDIAAGRVEQVRCFRRDGKYQPAGDYPMGAGTLRVLRDSPNGGFIFVVR